MYQLKISHTILKKEFVVFVVIYVLNLCLLFVGVVVYQKEKKFKKKNCVMQVVRRKSTKQLLNQHSFQPEIEAINVGGIYVHAICNNGKVDIINVDDGRYIQSILENNSVLVSWSLRTSHLAILTYDCIILYECIFDQVSFKPYWSKFNTIDIKASIINFNIENIRNISFQYPNISVVHGDIITLHNCVNIGKFHTLSSASGTPSIANQDPDK